MNCTACTAALDAPAQLCPACVRGLDVRLSELPAQYLLLATHLRPGAARGDGPVALVREAPLPVRADVLDIRAEGGIVTVLESWREAVQHARGWDTPVRAGTIERRVMAAARGLRMQLEFIAAEFGAADDLHNEVRDLAGFCRAILDPEERTRNIGTCAAVLQSGAICDAALRVPESETRVVCRRCGTEYPPNAWLTLATGAWAAPAGAAA